MRPKTIVLLALALGCGSIAAVGINQVLANRNAPVELPKGETQPILVAMADVGMGDLLNPQVVKLEAWPKDKVPPGALTKLEDVDGRRARTKLFAGEPILDAKLLGKNDQAGSPADFIPKGFRVVSVKVDEVVAAASMLKPGDRVDVLVHLRANPGSGIDETQTRTILQDIKVFAVNDIFHRQSDAPDETIAAKTVSLLVTPDQAELVTLATELGTIRLVMRSLGDDTVASTNGASHQQLLGASDSGNRDGEEPAQDGNELLDLLAGKKKKEEPEPTALGKLEEKVEEAAVKVWRMLVIEADKAREMEFNDHNRIPSNVLQLEAQPGADGTLPAPSAGPAAPDGDAETSEQSSESDEQSQDADDDQEKKPTESNNVSNT